MRQVQAEVREEGASGDKDQDAPQESSCAEPAATQNPSSHTEPQGQAGTETQGQSWGGGTKAAGRTGTAGQARVDSGWEPGQAGQCSEVRALWAGRPKRTQTEKRGARAAGQPRAHPPSPGRPRPDSGRRAPRACSAAGTAVPAPLPEPRRAAARASPRRASDPLPRAAGPRGARRVSWLARVPRSGRPRPRSSPPRTAHRAG